MSYTSARQSCQCPQTRFICVLALWSVRHHDTSFSELPSFIERETCSAIATLLPTCPTVRMLETATAAELALEPSCIDTICFKDGASVQLQPRDQAFERMHIQSCHQCQSSPGQKRAIILVTRALKACTLCKKERKCKGLCLLQLASKL